MGDLVMWEVLLKGSFASDSNGYEVSVNRITNRFGRESWGWGGKDKIVLFSTGVGCNQLPLTEESSQFALSVANRLAEVMNRDFPPA
jgi:hypothetical protein